MKTKEKTYALSIGTVLHGKTLKYERLKVLGSGTFGITYQAKVVVEGAYQKQDITKVVAVKEFFMNDLNGRQGTMVSTGGNSQLFNAYRKKFRKESQCIRPVNNFLNLN